MRRPGLSRRIAVFVGLAGLAACAETAEPPPGTVEVDTLSNGAVFVRNTGPGRWAVEGRPAWTLVEEVRIGSVDSEGPDMFGSVREVIPDARGRIWVMDSQAFELRLFGPDGEFVRSVGGEGDGPGEFGFNPCASAAPDGQIWVESGGHWQRFDSAGVLLGRQPVTRSLGCGVTAWRGDQFVAVTADWDPETRDFDSSFILHDRLENGAVVPTDTVPVTTPPGGPTVTWLGSTGRPVVTSRMPLTHGGTFRLGAEGDLWVTDGGGEYRLRRESIEGDTLLVVERSYEPVPVPDSVREAEIESLDREDLGWPDDFDRDDVPRVFPPFDRIYEGKDGTLCLRRQVEGGVYELDVFDEGGVYLGPVGTFEGFANASIFEITSTHVYGRVRDDLDVSYVVRWRIDRSGG